MLHTLAHSPWKSDIDTLLHMICNGDDLLLLQDGVVAAINNTIFLEKFKNTSVAISTLKEDVEARGLAGRIASNIAVIDYIDFVNLVIKHTNQMNW